MSPELRVAVRRRAKIPWSGALVPLEFQMTDGSSKMFSLVPRLVFSSGPLSIVPPFPYRN